MDNTRYLKRLAKMSGLTYKQVAVLWESEKKQMLAEGKDPLTLDFLQELSNRTKRTLEITEKHVALDKFKSYLRGA